MAAAAESDQKIIVKHTTIDVQSLLDTVKFGMGARAVRTVQRSLKKVLRDMLDSLRNAEEKAIVATAQVQQRDYIQNEDDFKYRTHALNATWMNLERIVTSSLRPTREFVQTFNTVVTLARLMKPVIDIDVLNRDTCVCTVDEAHAIFHQLKSPEFSWPDAARRDEFCPPGALDVFQSLSDDGALEEKGDEHIDTSVYIQRRDEFDSLLKQWRLAISHTRKAYPRSGQFARMNTIMECEYPRHNYMQTEDDLQRALGDLKLWKRDIDLLSLAHQFMTGTLRAIVRIRRKDDAQSVVVQKFSDTKVVVGHGQLVDAFHVFGPRETTESVYEQVEPFVTSLMMGGDVFLIATGQTGSGKTFTMSDVTKRVFASIATKMTGTDDRVMMGGVEMHCGLDKETMNRTPTNVRDLLSDNEDVFVRSANNDDERRVSVYSCRSVHYEYNGVNEPIPLSNEGITLARVNLNPGAAVDTESDVLQSQNPDRLLKAMNDKRTTSPTPGNETSSRSHMVVTLFYQKMNVSTGRYQNHGFLHLIDLAGSEAPLPANLENVPIHKVVASTPQTTVDAMATQVAAYHHQESVLGSKKRALVNAYVLQREQGRVINESLKLMKRVISGWVRSRTSTYQTGQPIVNLLLRAQSLERDPDYVTTGRVMFICCLSPDQKEESVRTLEIVQSATMQQEQQQQTRRRLKGGDLLF